MMRTARMNPLSLPSMECFREMVFKSRSRNNRFVTLDYTLLDDCSLMPQEYRGITVHMA